MLLPFPGFIWRRNLRSSGVPVEYLFLAKTRSFPNVKMLKKASSVAICAITAGCSLVSTSGPTSHSINQAQSENFQGSDILVLDADAEITRRMSEFNRPKLFSDIFGEGMATDTVVTIGDTLDISIWEAPPATLFGSGNDARAAAGNLGGAGSRATPMPEQTVDNEGRIFLPFAGSMQVAGKTPRQIQEMIVARLAGKAHQPQAIVRQSHIANAVATILGDVASNTRVALTPKGERLLDGLASAGGARQPVGKTTIRLTRDGRVASLPLEAILRDPRQNIRLKPNDVVTALFQPYSFTALGATGRNEEIPFEATGITLSQALGRAAGLQDARADAKGVFIFRFEDPAVLRPDQVSGRKVTPEGKIPTIYRINIRDPKSLFLAQTFLMQDKDVMYVSNAPLADIQKFINVIYSSILPFATLVTIAP